MLYTNYTMLGKLPVWCPVFLLDYVPLIYSFIFHEHKLYILHFNFFFLVLTLWWSWNIMWKEDSQKKSELDWKKRLQIIIGAAEGLEYLHKGCQLRIIHRDIKASNILLDSKWKPKIADFGLARFSCGSGLPGATIAGTLYVTYACH